MVSIEKYISKFHNTRSWALGNIIHWRIQESMRRLVEKIRSW